MGGKGAEIKKHNWYVQNRQGEVKNSIGNGEAKPNICLTHGHELRCRGDCWREEGLAGRGWQRGGNWDNCNNIIEYA